MQFLYFTDPMCSWCYGFGPVMRRLAATFGGRIPLHIVPGGLRPDETRALTPQRAAEIVHHWSLVEAETGRDFDPGFFKHNAGFVYDTFPASRAVTAASRAAPARALAYLDELQSRFYAKGEDPRSEATQVAAAQAAGLPVDAFRSYLHDADTEALTRAGFARFQSLGGMGFPFLLLETAERPRIVSIGYQSYEHLEGVVRNILSKIGQGLNAH